jgi:ribosomal protein L18E
VQAASAAKVPAADVLTNADVIAMVAAKLDQANIIDTIKTSSVNFDLSARGQIDLAKGNVNGTIIQVMKQKARGQ